MRNYRIERLLAAVGSKNFGGNVTSFARALGFKDGAFVRQLLAGQRPITEKTIAKIEALPGLSGWFNTDRYAPGRAGNVLALHVGERTPDEVVPIPVSNVKFSAGPGHEASYEIEESSEPAYYQRAWFSKHHINPDRARRFKVSGDSMEPFVYAGDHVLVDTGDTSVMDGRIYALRYGNELRIKRVWRHLDGTLVLRSDNAAYVEEKVSPLIAAEHITIIGRVRDRSGPGGL